jgi:hypothetical protein
MATTANPQLTLGTNVFVVALGNGEIERHKGAVFFRAVVEEITWGDTENQYRYRLVGAKRTVWMPETKLNIGTVGEYFSTNQNNARAAFRTLSDSQYP